MEFRTAYSQEVSKPSIAGNREIKTYAVRLNKNGQKVLVEDGVIDIYERIQEHKEEADLHTILDRAKQGDMKSLELLQNGQHNGKGGIVDLTTMPRNLIEAQQKLIDAQKTWDGLDKKLKAKFNNSLTEFLAGTTDGRVQSWLDEKNKANNPDKATPAVQNKEEVKA